MSFRRPARRPQRPISAQPSAAMARAACEPLEDRYHLTIESVWVPTDGSSVTSGSSLQDGVSYQLRASGTFYMGVPSDGMADAEYGDFSAPKDHSVGTGVDYGVAVNGGKPHWGPYSSDHVYTIDFNGTGGPLTFSYQDDYLQDNSGWILVEIIATQPPAAPSGLTATAIGASKIELTWTDNSGDEQYFILEQKKEGESDFAFIASLSPNTTTYTAIGLEPSTTYTYRLAAYNSLGPSAYSNEASATTFEADSGTVHRNDDESTELVHIGFEINFFGVRYDELYVNNNGNLTFNSPQGSYTPDPLTTAYGGIIAPFFADVDTRPEDSGTVTYGPITTPEGRKAFKASWDNVGYYSHHTDKRNTFSVTLIDRKDINVGDFDIEFDYGSIQWDTGDASGGLGGVADPEEDPQYVYPARIGFSNGSGQEHTYEELPGSGTSGAFLGSGPGHQHFEIRNADLDIDSDNNNDFSNPGRTEEEERIESLGTEVGRIIVVNDDDNDGDFIPDFADFDQTPGPGAVAETERFVPVTVELPEWIDPAQAQLRFNYNASDPAYINVTGESPFQEYWPSSGTFRLWTQDGADSRTPSGIDAGGHFITPYHAYAATQLGFNASTRVRTFWVEAVAVGGQFDQIELEIDSGAMPSSGFFRADIVNVRAVRFDLDIDNDGYLGGSDGVNRYMPGMLYDQPALTSGSTLYDTTYQPQQMQLVLDGLTATQGIDEIYFRIVDPTEYEGVTGNYAPPITMDPGNTDDYAFAAAQNLRQQTGTTVPSTSRTTTPIFAKDYGGMAQVQVWARKAGNDFRIATRHVYIDRDNDQLGDFWEMRKIIEWNQIYGTNENALNLGFFGPNDDHEPSDPDGNGPLIAHRNVGDRLLATDEFRGAIMDGGGFDNTGQNAHQGGFIRFSPAKRETLLEVDHRPTQALLNLPPGGVADYFNVSARVLNHATRGAGIYQYWVVENNALPAPNFVAGDPEAQAKAKILAYLSAHRGRQGAPVGVNQFYRRLTTHVVLIEDVPNGYPPTNAWTVQEISTQQKDEMGVYMIPNRLANRAAALGVGVAELGGIVAAHEFTHMVIQPAAGPVWNAGEHEIGNPGGDAMMADVSVAANRQEATVVIKATTQQEYNLSGNPTLH